MKPHFVPAELAEFRSIIRLPVQWGDQDAFGHVNNVVYFRWFESSRIAYFEQSGINKPMETAGLGPILASIKCNYRQQIVYPDVVLIGAKITGFRNSSLTMVHMLYSERLARIAADSDSVIVAFDYQANNSRRIPDPARSVIDAFEAQR